LTRLQDAGQSADCFRLTVDPQGNALTTETPVLPKVATGEPAAVAECLDRYGNLVWSLARRSCPDVQAAEDAVQDIFLKLWTVADRFDPEIASESTFVAMIARRRLIDLSRKKSLKPTGAVELEHLTHSDMDAASRVEINDEAAKARVLLEKLPADQQQVIKLSVYDGLSHSRIAEATGLSLGTVKTHMRRGMLKLRNSLFPGEDSINAPLISEGETS
jgi:RNA polymerase sigma factor (sigma-70 family)